MTGEWATAFARVPELAREHLLVSFAAIGLALLLCAPLAVAAHRNRRFAAVALGLASLVQTIPGLALLALFFPVLLAVSTVLGEWVEPLGFLPALLALTLYALLPILRNAVTGLAGVDPAALEAAEGLGMTRWQKLRLVELPLALPTIVAGIRTAAVWTIGAATLATTIGQPSLGDLIFAGLQTQAWTLVLAGCAGSAALALSVDGAIALAQRGVERRQRLTGAIAGLMIAALAAFALWPQAHDNRPQVTIGAKGFSEQYILARLIGLRLERAGYAVDYRDNLGSGVLHAAVASGQVDIGVDYAGTLWTNELKRSDRQPREAMIAGIAAWMQGAGGARLIGPLGFENAYAFAVTRATAERLSLGDLHDLARAAPMMTLGTDPEFLERPEWRAVDAAYGMGFAGTRSLSPGFMYDALASNEADVITAYTSDGRVAADRLVLLADPEGAIPSYDALLVAHVDAAGDAGVRQVLDGLIGAIDVRTMAEANHMVDRVADKRSIGEAAAWLDAQIRAEERAE